MRRSFLLAASLLIVGCKNEFLVSQDHADYSPSHVNINGAEWAFTVREQSAWHLYFFERFPFAWPEEVTRWSIIAKGPDHTKELQDRFLVTQSNGAKKRYSCCTFLSRSRVPDGPYRFQGDVYFILLEGWDDATDIAAPPKSPDTKRSQPSAVLIGRFDPSDFTVDFSQYSLVKTHLEYVALEVGVNNEATIAELMNRKLALKPIESDKSSEQLDSGVPP